MNVSVIIVNYNTTAHILKCIDSIYKFTFDVDYEINVVDNNSTERGIENLSILYPNVNLFLRNVNDGFGAGCNFGAKYSKGKYLFFVNPDIIFRSNAVKEFYTYMEKHINISACSGLMIGESGGLIYSYNYLPNLKSEFGEAFWIGFKRRKRKLLEKNEIYEGKEFEIGYSLGALVFVRKNAFENIKGFDERFFLYGEDIDLGYRLNKCVGKIMCLPYIRVYHYYFSSIKGYSGKFIESYHLNRSKMIYAYKHYNFIQRTLTRLFMIIGISIRLIFIPLNGKYKGEKIRYFYRVFSSMLIFFKKIDLNNLGKYYR